MLDDCTNASDNRKNPNSRVDHSSRSCVSFPQIHHPHRHRSGGFGHVIDRRDRRVGIFGQSLKPESASRVFAIDRESSGSQCGRAHRAQIDVDERVLDARRVTRQKLARAQQIMRQRSRLRRLRMGMGRHHRVQMLPRQVEQHRAQRCRRLRHLEQFPPRRHAIQRDRDVVAAARGVHFARRIHTRGLLQHRLYKEK